MSLGEDGSRLTAILASGLLNPFPSLPSLSFPNFYKPQWSAKSSIMVQTG